MSMPSYNTRTEQTSLSSSDGPQTRSTITNPSLTDYGPNPNPNRGFIDVHNPPQENNDSLASLGLGPSTGVFAQELGITYYTSTLRTDQSASGNGPLSCSSMDDSSFNNSQSSEQSCSSNNGMSCMSTSMLDQPSNNGTQQMSLCTDLELQNPTADHHCPNISTTENDSLTAQAAPCGSQQENPKCEKVPMDTVPQDVPPDYCSYREASQERSQPRSPPPSYTPREYPDRIEIPSNQRAIEISTPGVNINIRNSNTVQVGNNNVLRVYQHTRGTNIHGGQRRAPKPEKKKVTLEVSKRIVTEADMDVVVSNLGKEWRVLGTKLGVSAADLDAVEYDYRHHGLKETTRQMLLMWKEQKAMDATLKNLTTALLMMKKSNIAFKFSTENT